MDDVPGLGSRSASSPKSPSSATQVEQPLRDLHLGGTWGSVRTQDGEPWTEPGADPGGAPRNTSRTKSRANSLRQQRSRVREENAVRM